MTPANPIAAAFEIKDALQVRDIDRAARLLEDAERRWPEVSWTREKLMVGAANAVNHYARSKR